MNHIYLTGFMGAGKSTVGMELAKLCECRLLDTDQMIVKKAGMSISEIFETYGEPEFRRLETACLRDLESEKAAVVACGGGVVMNPENVTIMKRSGRIVLLEATPEVILERVSRNDRRPLLQGKKDIDHIREMMNGRLPAYKAAADFRVRTDIRDINYSARQILRLTNLE